MSIFNGYLTGDERMVAIENATLENEYRKLETLFEMTQLQIDQMHKDAELKVFAESGSYDDLTYLYQEADAEVGEQRKNILQRIIDWFGKIFSKIGNAIKSLFGQGDANMEVEAPVEVVEKANAIQKCWNDMQNGVAKLRNGDFSGALDILKVVAIPSAIAVGGTVAYKKFKKGELDNILKKLESIKDAFLKTFESIKQKISGVKDTNQQAQAQKSFKPLQSFTNVINNIVSTISTCITNAIKGIKSKSSDGQENQGEQKGEPTNNQNAQEQPKEAPKKEDQKPVEAENNADQNTEPQNDKMSNKTIQIKSGGFTYYADANSGNVITVLDPHGNKVSYRQNKNVEQKIKKAMTKARTTTEGEGHEFTPEFVESMREIFGENAEFAFENGNIVITNANEVFETVNISVQESVFGIPVEDQAIVIEESVDPFDKEMMNLLADLKAL